MGSGHISYDARVDGLGQLILSGSFRPNGSSAISTAYETAMATASYISTGVYRVTFDSVVNVADLRPIVSMRLATGDTDAHVLRVGDFSVASRYFEIEHLASSDTTATHPVAADIASNAANWIDWMCVVLTTSAQGSGL